jgi:glycosyltransferase involved in cell wall biosynthesis
MRVAYIAPYQGPALEQRRPIVWNLSLAGRVKVEMIAELLRRKGHEVEILSQGEIIRHKLKFYPGFSDPMSFHPEIPVYYSSALPVKHLNGLWSGLSLLRAFKKRHQVTPYDAVMIYNFKVPQLICAKYASRKLRIPVVLEYEDDAFVSLWGEEEEGGLRVRSFQKMVKEIFGLVSAATAVSPYLRGQLPCSIPKLLLPGVVSKEVANSPKLAPEARRNWVAFSGTLFRSKGLEQLITAWGMVGPSDWELHIAGDGELRDPLRQLAAASRGIVFDGLLNRRENAHLLSLAKIGINPHDLSATPGNVFAFKIIEYLAAGNHVITTPMGPLDPELEKGITYIPDNRPETIAASLKQVIETHSYKRTAVEAALAAYGPDAVAKSLDELFQKVVRGQTKGRTSEVGSQRSEVTSQPAAQ